jgi:predicted RNA-binding Zn-ribbon protein involved in translation (DUF1610 family)
MDRTTPSAKDVTPRTTWIKFACPQCGGCELAWDSFDGAPKRAIIAEMLLVEGNSHPLLVGEYQIGFPAEKRNHQPEGDEWSCAKCGVGLAKDDGSPVRTKTEFIEWWIRHRAAGQREDGLAVSEQRSGKPVASIFDLGQDGILGFHDQPLTLACPVCGHGEFVQREEAFVFTPMRGEDGKLRQVDEEQLIDIHGSQQEAFYQCLNCGFEAPESFDEWVCDGCPEEWEA